MKPTQTLLFLAFLFLSGLTSGQQKDKKGTTDSIADQMVSALKPRTYCRFVPEREDDFMFENNYITMRFYGPALRDKIEGSGCDVWTKSVAYPVINKWHKLSKAGYSYHIDRGEGWDGYKVGNSAGTGGTALWIKGKREELDCFTKWKVLENTEKRCSFILTYEAQINGATYQEEKKITLEMNQRLYNAESTFFKNGKPAQGLSICVGLTTHDGAASVTADPLTGWISCWETLKDGFGLGTAVAMSPKAIKSVEYIMTKPGEKNTGHILLITKTNTEGKINYAAGFGWEKEGSIVSQDIWSSYLKNNTKNLFKP